MIAVTPEAYEKLVAQEGIEKEFKKATTEEKASAQIAMAGSLLEGDVKPLEGKPGGHPLGMNEEAEGKPKVAAGVGLVQIILALLGGGGGKAAKETAKELGDRAIRRLRRFLPKLPVSGKGIPGGQDAAEALEDIGGLGKKLPSDTPDVDVPDEWMRRGSRGFIHPTKKAALDAKAIIDRHRKAGIS